MILFPFQEEYDDFSNYKEEEWPKYIPWGFVAKYWTVNGDIYLMTWALRLYISNWRSGQYAVRLARFIKKVLIACYGDEWDDNPDAKVDIVAHSMGGLVARSAITYLTIPGTNIPVKDKVRKLLTIGTPNFGISGGNLATLFSEGHPDWMEYGEDVECNVWPQYSIGRVEVYFVNTETGDTTKTWTGWLSIDDDYITEVKYSTIAGTRGRYENLYGENDGVVCVGRAWIREAEHNAVIYAGHDHGTTTGNIIPTNPAQGEYSLTECTFTTEFIKKWIIDDEEIVGGALQGDPYLSYQGNNVWTGENKNNEGASLRLYPNVSDFSDILVLHAVITGVDIEDDGITYTPLKSWGIPVYKCENPLDALVFATNPWRLYDDEYDLYQARIRIYDMDGYIYDYDAKEHYDIIFNIDPKDSAKILPRRPMPGEVVLVGWDSLDYRTDWWTNDYGVRRRLFYSTDNGASWIPIMDDGYETITDPGDLYLTWDVSGLSDCNYAKVKVEYYLGRHAKLIAETEGPFIMRVPPIYPKRWNKWLAGDVRDIEVAEDAPNYVFAIVDNKLFKSSDFGKTWQRIFPDPGCVLYSLGVSRDGKLIVVGGGEINNTKMEINVSKDGGKSFFLANIGASYPLQAYPDVVMDKDKNIFIGYAEGAIINNSPWEAINREVILRSSDKGKTWEVLHVCENYFSNPAVPPSPEFFTRAIELGWSEIDPEYLYFVTQRGSGYQVTKYLSLSSGDTVVIKTGYSDNPPHVEVINDNGKPRVYVNYGNRVYSQIPVKDGGDGGWNISQYIDAHSPVLSLASSEKKGMLIASTGWYACGVYLEKNRDNDWEKITTRWGVVPRVVEVSPVDAFSNSWNGIYYVGRNDGLYVYNPFYGPPGQITGVAVTEVTQGGIRIEWNGIDNAYGYWVCWGYAGGYTDSSFIPARSPNLTYEKWISTGKELVKIKVVAENFEGRGAPVELEVRRIFPPKILAKFVGNANTIEFVLKDRSSFETGYEVYRKDGSTDIEELIAVLPSYSKGERFIFRDSTVSPDIAYEYRFVPLSPSSDYYVLEKTYKNKIVTHAHLNASFTGFQDRGHKLYI
ncbi:hypothetical protein DRQ20_04545, partial [bacterium]